MTTDSPETCNDASNTEVQPRPNAPIPGRRLSYVLCNGATERPGSASESLIRMLPFVMRIGLPTQSGHASEQESSHCGTTTVFDSARAFPQATATAFKVSRRPLTQAGIAKVSSPCTFATFLDSATVPSVHCRRSSRCVLAPVPGNA